MNEGWSTRRKLAYAGAVVTFITILFVYLFREMLFPNPTCFDGKMNGFESGLDCGGECSLQCSQDVIPLSVQWSAFSKTSSTTYDLITYVSNKNLDNVPRVIGYLFIVYNKEGNEMQRVYGSTTVPLGDFPIIRQSVTLSAEPKTIGAVITNDVKHYKVKEKPSNPTIRESNKAYEAGSIPRVYADLTNTTRRVFRNIPVYAVLYDADGNAFAGGETIIVELGKEETERVVFTWKKAFEQAPVRIGIYPIMDPFLGEE